MKDSIKEFWTEQENRNRWRSGCRRAIEVVALVLGFYILDAVLRRASAIPEEAYFGATPLLSVFTRPWSWVLILAQGALLFRWRGLNWDFGDTVLGGNYGARVVFGAMALILAWHFGLYRPNHYFGQAHALERAVVLVGAMLVIWRPVFIPVFLLGVHVASNQFAYPIGGYSVAQPFMLVRCLTVLMAFLLARILRPRLEANGLIAVLLAVIATAYWINGFQKVRMGWLSLAEPHFLLFSSYTTGWLAQASAESLSAIGRFLDPMAGIMKWGTIIIECGVVVFAARRSLFLLSAAGLVAFHASVFLLTGIAFWMWSLLEVVLIVWVLRKSDRMRWVRFAAQYGVMVLVMTWLGQHLFHPTMLSWFDSRMSYSYRFEAVTKTDERFVLGPLFFRPYDYQFTVGAMGYLSEEPVLPIVWGATHRPEIARALQTVNDPTSAFSIEQALGSVQFTQSRAERMDRFLQHFVTGAAQRQKDASSLEWMPYRFPQLWTLNDESERCDLSQIRRVDVVKVTSLFDGEQYQVLRESTVRTVPIDQID